MAQRDTLLWLSSGVVMIALGCSSAHEPGALACSAGDAPPACGSPWDPTLACCRPAGDAACVAGRWQCSSGDVLASSCGRISICEGVDSSVPRPRDAGGPPPSDAGGGPPAWQVCSSPTDCVVRPASCCGSCGAATPGDMIGVNRAHGSDYDALACPGGIACPGCFSQQEPSLVATCSRGLCEAIDLGATPATECVSDTDCNLAVPQCCTCGTTDPWQVVSIATAHASDFYDLFCDPRIACEPCPGPITFPAGLSAGCDTGRCVVRGRP